MRYTKSQEAAIYYQGKNVLVSASAGSGKTGVLKERVIQKLKAGIDIDQLVILTFTEAAACEMKSRIISEIHQKNLINQIDKIDNAIISTFDAFTLRLVKEYHYLLGLDNQIGINDQVIIKSRKQEIIKEILKTYYQENSPEFNQFFKRYFAKSDLWLAESIYLIGEAFRKMPNYFDVIENYQNRYLDDDFLNKMADVYLFNFKQQIQDLYSEFKTTFIDNVETVVENYQDYLLNLDKRVIEILKIKDPIKLFNTLLNPNLPVKPRKSELVKPQIAKEIENIADELNELFLTEYQDLVMNFKTAIPSIKMLLQIVSDYLKKFEEIKLAEGL
ncbi:MAG: UvrD-helicase domain-containing protein, partial [Candidatus Izemoplasmatales bacterium]